MNKKGRIFLAILFVGVLLFNINHKEVIAKAAETTLSASQAYTDNMAPGWNLGNTFESVDIYNPSNNRGEETWGNPKVTKEFLHSIKEMGYNSIRMPFTVTTRMGDAPNYKINDDYLKRYGEVVQWAVDEGLYVIVDMHGEAWIWGTNIGSDDGTAMNKFKVLWKQVAEYFKDYSDKVSFESFNEPKFNGSKEDQLKINNEVNDTFREIIRNSGGKNATRMLILPLLNTNAEQAECDSLSQNILSSNDKNIIATYHYYSYWPFSVNIAGTTTFDATTQKHAKDSIDVIYKGFVEKGIGVVCGEYGVLGTVDHGEYLKYLEYVNHYAKDNGITLMLWDNGGLLNRRNISWEDNRTHDIEIQEVNSIRSSYTESDKIFITKKTRNSDISTPLYLNGNKLLSISDGSKTLVEGNDYKCEDGKLILNNSYLKEVLTGNYGTNKTLTLKFSKGIDWTVNIIYCSTAISSNATGTTQGLTIPVQFNGEVLATMEAVYEDGSFAGPNDWTPYKEFTTTFEPNYTNNTLLIKDKFFENCKDGIINLKFHFRNGEVTEYKLTKSGSTVKGTAINNVAPTVKLGDVNEDEKVDVLDLVALNKYIKNPSGAKINIENADLNGDGKVSSIDFLLLKKYLSGKIDKFPVEK